MKNYTRHNLLASCASFLLVGFMLFAGCGNGTPGNDGPGGGTPTEPEPEYNEEYAFNLMTYNIWVQNSGNDGWANRKSHVKKRIEDNDADIVAMQEVMRPFITDLKAMMPDFSFYGIGRDKGGEGSDIMWRTERFSLLRSGEFWYSDTPDISSNGWDGGFYRMCTWVKLKDNRSGKEFFVFNSHMALELEGRVKSSELLIEKVGEIAGDTPYYCTGDFNSEPLETPMAALRKVMVDSFLAADKKEGPTMSGLTFPSQADFSNPSKRIDFCMMNRGAKAYLNRVVGDDITERFRASDHLPVLIRTVPSAE